MKQEAAEAESAEKADDFEALADLFARKEERPKPAETIPSQPEPSEPASPRSEPSAKPSDKTEKSIDELLEELAATLKAPSGDTDKSAGTGYGKKLEALLEELKADAPSKDADTKKDQ